MSEHRKSIHGTKLKNGMSEHLINGIKMGRYNTYITLSTNYEYELDKVMEKVTHWSNNISSRMFRSKKFHNDETETSKFDSCFRYYGFLEKNASDCYHYHLIAYIHPDRENHFKNIAQKFWKNKVRQGTADIQSITLTPDKLVSYVTKDFDKPFNYKNFIFLN